MGSICLPLDVLNQQICESCGNYLSLGPVRLSFKGEAVCGRSKCQPLIEGESGDSLYNIVATVCLFKCTYHHSGCDALLTFKEVDSHEEHCPHARLYDCPLCFFQGNGCELVKHFGKAHPVHMPTGNVLEKILSYKGINKHIGTIVRMNTIKLRHFMGHAPKLFLATCHNCNIKIAKKENIYLCTKYHIACPKCSRRKCIKCKTFQPWTRNSVLDRISIKCEWRGCPQENNVFEYLWHKQACGYRPYQCPCPDCKYVSYLSCLKKHWHLSPLYENDYVELVPGEHMYWLPPLYKEIVYVTFEIDHLGDAVITFSNEHDVLPVCFRVNIIDIFGIKSWLKKYPLNSVLECSKIKCFKIEGFNKNDYSYVILEAVQ